MQISERIINDSEFITKLKLSELRLLKDGDLDWFVLIPLKENLIEWCDLTIDDQIELTREIDLLTKALKDTGYDKVNIGSLGNIVPQLHIHIIGRKITDRAWPAPIWGTKPLKEFNPSRVNYWKSKIK